MLGRKSNGFKNLPLSHTLKQYAWEMRNHPTPAEAFLWEHLRLKRLDGFRFRRQHIIGKYIADFYCHESGLVVEVDGSSHDFRILEDNIRDQAMRSVGITVLRLENEFVLNNVQAALQRIRSCLPVLPRTVTGVKKKTPEVSGVKEVK